MPELSEEQWVRFLDLVVERAGHLAALLDREMPPHLVEDASAAGVELLPGVGDLEPECDCDAWDHCGHTAALCHQMARLLDEDPFVLLLLRGRGKHALLDALQLRTTVSGMAETPHGVDAVEAWAAGAVLPPLPAPPLLPDAPGRPPSFDTDAAPAPGIDPVALAYLAAQTATEAHRLLAEALRGKPFGLVDEAELEFGQDVVRLAAGAPEGSVADRLADGSGRGRDGLARAVRAWHHGGTRGLSLLDEEWQVEGTALARARAALEEAWDEEDRPVLRREGNRWTVQGEGVQLRLGREGSWWPYYRKLDHWTPAGEAARDPATALVSARLALEEERSAEADGSRTAPG